MVKKSATVEPAMTSTEPIEISAQPTRLEMLEMFADLVAEQVGYKLGRKANVSEANKTVKADATKAREIGKEFKEAISALRKEPNEANAKTADEKENALVAQRKVVAKARKPFNEKNKPLTDGVKYIENIALPDSLKELGKTVAPRFSLSDWAKKAVDASKKKD